MSKGIWGIDASKSSLKAVRLEMHGETPVLTDVEVVPYEGSAGNAQELDDFLRTTLEDLKGDLHGEPVMISLPSHSTFNRLIKLPPVDEEKIPEIVQYEAESQIPFNIDEVIWDYQVIERDYAPGEEKEVILFAIKRDIVDQFLQNIGAVGLNLEGVQFAPVALYNFLGFDQGLKGATIALDLGGENTDLVIIDGEKFWVRNLPMSGSEITKALEKTFNIAYADAEKLKIRAAQSQQAQKIFAAIQPSLRDLVGEIHRSVGYYKSISKTAKFDKLLLLGKGSKLINLQRFVTQSLSTMGNLPAARLQKLHRINTDRVDAGVLNANLATIGGALGLALQGFDLTPNRVNLLPHEFRRKKELKKKQPWIIGAVTLLYVLLLLMYATIRSSITDLQGIKKEAEAADQKFKRLQFRLNDAKKVTSREAALQSLTGLTSDRQVLLSVMKMINHRVPDNGRIAEEFLALSPLPTRSDENRRAQEVWKKWALDRIWVVDWNCWEEPVVEKEAAKKTEKPAPAGAKSAAPTYPAASNLRVQLEVCIHKRGGKVEGTNFILKTLLRPDASGFIALDGFALPRGFEKGYGWDITPEEKDFDKPLPSAVTKRQGSGVREGEDGFGLNYWRYTIRMTIPMGKERQAAVAKAAASKKGKK